MNEVVENGKKDIVTENVENRNEVAGSCPNCGSVNLVLTLETLKGFRYKCDDCDETFVAETKFLGKNIKALTQIPKIVNEIDERKTIKIPKKTYVQLESIRQDAGLTTLIDATAYAVNEYKTRKEFEAKILQVISGSGENIASLMNTFWADFQKGNKEIMENIKEIKMEIQELKKQRALEWKPVR